MEVNVSGKEQNTLQESVGWLRAAGEPTRLRILALLNEMELTVSDLLFILDQSQPRVSRHLKLLVEAGLAQRFQEGAWAYFRTVDKGSAGVFLDRLLGSLSHADDNLKLDFEKLDKIRKQRTDRADDYFTANAEQWGKIRSLHIPEERVEVAMLEMGLAQQPQSVLDLGTGTGRILELFASHVERGVGLDASHNMLAVARAALASDDFDHIQVRQGDVYDLGEGDSYDLIIFHQVMHFLEEPWIALDQAAGRLNESGCILIADFAAHDFEFLRDEHAHRRLGMTHDQLSDWAGQSGLTIAEERILDPQGSVATPLTVMLWLLSAN